MRLRKGWARAIIRQAYAAGVPMIWIVRAAMPVNPASRLSSRRLMKALNHVCAIAWEDRDIEVTIRRESRRTGR